MHAPFAALLKAVVASPCRTAAVVAGGDVV